MSALVENMFYVSNEANSRFVPWHGLGTPVADAPDSKTALEIAGLDWTVDSRPIYDAFGKEIEGFKATTRSSDNSVLGIVSNKYKIVQNEQAFEFTDNIINDDVRYETAGSLNNGKRIWLLAKLPTEKILNDDVDPYICFSNNHDGCGAVKVCMTPIRVVCNNTLNFALESASRSWSTRHMGNIQDKLEEAKNTLGLANLYMKELNTVAEELVNKKLTDVMFEKIFDEIFIVSPEDSERKVANILTKKEAMFKCLEAPDLSQYRGTAWGAIQAVTDFVDHSAPVRKTQKYRENNWGQIMTGHSLVDTMFEKIKIA